MEDIIELITQFYCSIKIIMLAIHWSPVSNTKRILKDGIIKSQNGVYCFPLTGQRAVDTWWVKAFNQYKFRKDKKKYNGFIFRIEQGYLPAYFGHWVGATSQDVFKKPINEINELEKEVRQTILFRIGENIIGYPDAINYNYNYLIKIAQNNENSKEHYNSFVQDLDCMTFTFEDLQIVLDKSIPAKNIISVVSSQNEFGKVLYKNKKNQLDTNECE